MSNSKAAADKYQKLYADINFGRGELFEFIQEKYHPTEVLYPGCSIHITPAFYFPHVVFVDQAPQAVAFFSDRAPILDLVNRRRKYQRKSWLIGNCRGAPYIWG
jgi:hypothetical protein